MSESDFEAGKLVQDSSQLRAEEASSARLLEELDADQERQQLTDLLQDERMRDFCWRVLCECGIYKVVFDRNAAQMALNEGRRSFGLWLLNEIAVADPQAEMKMKVKANTLARQTLVNSRRQKVRPS